MKWHLPKLGSYLEGAVRVLWTKDNGEAFQELPLAQEAHEVQAVLLFLLEVYEACLEASFAVSTHLAFG